MFLRKIDEKISKLTKGRFSGFASKSRRRRDERDEYKKQLNDYLLGVRNDVPDAIIENMKKNK